ncbi:hypothetical protein Ancab_038309 [Ancistrocladus abbreviatus]
MTTKSTDPNPPAPAGETYPPSQAGPPEHQRSRASGNATAISQKSGEVNLTLGGIDLNNSGSVEVKPDKKLLTVLFPDGRDGRAFTLKAETLEDLYEWKTALESALVQAPSATLATGQNGVLKNDQADAVNGPSDQQKDKLPVKSTVIGRPILLALEDIDGSPSFLEKALKFIEDHGVRVEGILRQAADVEEVERRVREYEQGKTEFPQGEDAHVIADCVKHVLRELPSYPVPASCCNALLEAFRTDRNNRVNNMRTAILETFPEPNRHLLQRMLKMMQTVVLHKAENRMSTSAVAACMAPLLLRPLLAGDCEVENHHLDVAGDGSFQLLQAAAAANHAQAIIITLLDEYENIFGAGTVSPELFSDSEESGSETEDATDDEEMYEDDDSKYGTEDHETDDEDEHSVSGTGTDGEDDDDSYVDKHSEASSSLSKSSQSDDHHEAVRWSSSSSSRASTPRHDNMQGAEDANKQTNNRAAARVEESSESNREIPAKTSMVNEPAAHDPLLREKSASTFHGSGQSMRGPRWGRTSAQKNLSMESVDFSLDEEEEIKGLEAAKNDLKNRIAKEANGNTILQASLENRKKALHKRRLALEKDVTRLQEQLQKERDLRAALEAGLGNTQGPVSANIDEKTKNELQEIALAEEDLNILKQRCNDLEVQLNHQREQNYSSEHDRNNQQEAASSQGTILVNKQKDEASRIDKWKENESSKINKQKENETGKIDNQKDNDSNKIDKQKDNETSNINKEKDYENSKINKQKDNESSKINKQKDNEVSRIIKQKDDENKASSYQYERSTRSKEKVNHKSDGGDQDNERKHESPVSNKSQNQQADTARGGSSRLGGVLNNLAALDVTRPSSTSNSRKSSKGEGSNSTTFALSKLTTRLNFLKERKNQIANELQNLDKTRESTPSPRNSDKAKGLETNQSVRNVDKNQGLEGSIVQNPKDNAGQTSKISDQRTPVEVTSHNNQDGGRKASPSGSHNLLHQNSDRGRKSEGPQSQHLDRMKLDGQSSKNADKDKDKDKSQPSRSADKDKGRRSDGQNTNSSRR